MPVQKVCLHLHLLHLHVHLLVKLNLTFHPWPEKCLFGFFWLHKEQENKEIL